MALSCFADEGQKLHALFDADWEHTMAYSPTWASQIGDRRWNDRWPDVSLVAIESEHARDQEVLTQLTKIDRAALSPADRLNFDMFRLNYEQSLEGFRFARHHIALDRRGGIQTEDELVSALRFETVKDYEDWIARLRGFGAYMDQTIALLREGVRRGIVQPKVTMQRVPAQIEKQIVAGSLPRTLQGSTSSTERGAPTDGLRIRLYPLTFMGNQKHNPHPVEWCVQVHIGPHF